jgi:hypothetical protein
MSTAPPANLVVAEQPDGGRHYRLPRSTAFTSISRGVNSLLPVVLFCAALWIFFPRRRYLIVVLLAALSRKAWALIGWGLGRFISCCEVVVDRDGLGTVARIGPLRWTRRRPLGQVQRLVVSSYDERGWGPELLALCFEGPPLRLARMRFAARLEALALDLARRIKMLEPEAVDPVPVMKEPPDHPAATLIPPARSRIGLSEQDGSTVVVIPPPGFDAGLVCELIFGGLFLLAAVAIAFVVLFRFSSLSTAAAVLLAAIWLIGCRDVLGALNRANQRIILTVYDRRLQVRIVSLFRERAWQWLHDELKSISAAEASLLIRPRKGRRFKLVYHSRLDRKSREVECAWLASTLRQALALDTMN